MIRNIFYILFVFIPFCFIWVFKAFGGTLPFLESHFFEVEDLTFHVRLFEPSINPRGKVLFVHGLGGSTFSWRYAPGYLLNQGWFLVLVDLPAFGYSIRRGIGSREKQAEYLWKLIITLEEEGYVPKDIPWFLVGHSMGSGAVFLMSMEHREKVAGTVLIAPAFGKEGIQSLSSILTSSFVKRIFDKIIRWIFLSPFNVRRSLASAYGRMPTEEEFLGYLRPLQEKGTSTALLEFSLTASGVDLSAFEGKPHPPFLVILGENDSWTRDDTNYFLKKFPESSYFVIPGAHHCPMETHPAECFAYILDFFSKNI